jgi:prepilin-type N-terminal cleavage/methylation domain-containing protein
VDALDGESPRAEAGPVRSDGGGHTLLELLTALAVVGVALAAGLPRLEGWLVHLRTRAAAVALASDLALARAAAVREGSRVALIVEPDAGCPSPDPGAAGVRYRVEVVGSGRLVSTRSLRGGRRPLCLSTNRSDRVVFDPRGLLAGPNNRTLVVRQGGAAADSITLSAVGRVLRRF